MNFEVNMFTNVFFFFLRFDVVLKHADNKLLVPCRLPKAKPPTVHLERTKGLW